MNERLPYEQRLADKLNEVPLPDADSSWNRMKTLLDRDLPPGPGGGGDDGRMPGGRWWAFGVVIGVILITSWLGYYQGWLGNDHNRSVANSNNKQTNQQPGDSGNAERAGTGGASGATSIASPSDSNQSNTNDKNLLDPNTQSDNPAAGSTAAGNSSSVQNPKDGANAGSPSGKATNPDELVAGDKSNTSEANASNTNSKSKNKLKSDNPDNNHLAAGAGVVISGKGKSGRVSGNSNPSANQRYSNAGTKSKSNNSGNNLKRTSNAGNNLTANNRNNQSRNKSTRHTVPGVQSIQESDDAFDNGELAGSADNSLLASHMSNKKKIRARAENISNPVEDESSEDSTEKPNDAIGVVLGVSLYQNFAISSNLSFNYNSAGNKGILMDYLPSVYGQYHFNNKMYIQAELQFNMPQATPNLLLSHGYKESMISGVNYHVDEYIYLRKLYYFNIPVNFYYSPAKNFYLGAGLQFSSLNSGLAMVNQYYSPMVAGSGSPYNKSEVVKFKKDSLASLLSKSEFRFMLDVNYNYRWLTAGLRLNQALKDYVNLSFYGNTPSQDKNESLQLYLRFNVWDGRKRGKSATPTK